MMERLPSGTWAPVAVTSVRCALCGAFGELVLDGVRLDQAVQRAGDHVRETHPGASVPESLLVVPDVVFPPADCPDVADWVAQYVARNALETRA
ncbi:hypothetical protein [Streptomyces virginiae]|uniref:hypothetical protein n=1 Tax=Streptomyces virginiae TaxID=1961 RepID=UPI00344C85CE